MGNTPFSPIALVGSIALLLAYLLAAWCVAAGIAGNAHKSRRLVTSAVYGLYGFGALIALASALLIYGFVTHDFTIKYVAAVSDVNMSTWYKVTAFWGGLDGSLLFWVLVLALFSVVAILVNHKKHRDMMGYVVATIMVVQVFFLSLLIFTKNPFSTYLTTPPADGQGLNPLLQNYWMVIHPPSLYVGFVAATIPFAFGIGALASGRLDDVWIGSVRVWMLICFGFLSLGLILGGRWAYEELGWGGYWAWDPVENAGFMPWFTATAFLHSAIIQEQRGMMKMWNLVMVVLTFFLTIFGTFMTRSGAVQSVHAFGEDNVLALQFIVFMALILIVSIGLIVYRANKLSAKMQFESFYSREFAFLLNNWILLACAFFVLFATMFPTITEALDGSRVSVGIPFFNKWMTPLGLVLVFLAGAAPLLAWRKTTRERLIGQFMFPLCAMAVTVTALAIFFPQTRTTTAIFAETVALPVSLVNFGLCAFGAASIAQEFWRGTAVRRRQTGSDPVTSLIGLMISKRRKYGGYVVHLGVIVMFVGFAGKAYDREVDRTLQRPAIWVGLDESRTREERARFALDYLDLDDQTAEKIASGKLDPRRNSRDGTFNFPVPPMKARQPDWPTSAFVFGDYTFVFENLILTSDDLKTSVTAQMSIWIADDREKELDTARRKLDAAESEDEAKRDQAGIAALKVQIDELRKSLKADPISLVNLGDVYPAKWNYKKGQEPTSEVAIKVRIHEDVYSVLTGYDTDSGMANFRVFVNPLISWVWIGFLILGLGTLICLIPQSVVDGLTTRKGRLGNAGNAAILLLVAGALLAMTASTASAAAEHVAPGQGMGDTSQGWASMARPRNDLESKAMKELLCVCGCAGHQSIFDCKCKSAHDMRLVVMDFLSQKDRNGKAVFDLATADGRDQAYDAVLASFVTEYGGEHVLATPRNKMSWLLPTVAAVGGLGLLIVAGRRWIGRGKATTVAATPPASTVEDDQYAEKLDDALADED
ncbi:MAG: cytochrome c biogenesis protein CcsA [Deltaproteobacteria bacterium]|nr:cytochrome c biogenesis protein CcsA [Deltaproteobacteria bacterium]